MRTKAYCAHLGICGLGTEVHEQMFRSILREIPNVLPPSTSLVLIDRPCPARVSSPPELWCVNATTRPLEYRTRYHRLLNSRS
ncbi:hypothetical protein TNCV_3430171 [Trichonephila clavipes]|nr:hypothetical protein TNCV_3430171 [Trichonephila clavipes]